MIRLIRSRHLYGLTGSYNETLKRIAKETPGMQWSPPARAWIGYEDAVAIVVKRCREEGVGIIGDVSATKSETIAFPISYEGLYDYQKTGVDFIVTHAAAGCLLADQMSLGKSRQAIRAARAFKDKTAIVCPSFVRGVWGISSPERKCEIELGWPKAKFALLSTTKPKEISAELDVVIIHYDILYAWVDALIAWGAKFVIFDECQALMGPKTRRTQAALKLRRACAYRVGLSGTPMLSRPRDLWSVIETISEGRFGRFFTFALRHCGARREQVTPMKVVWKFDGASNLEELQERLRHGVMLRRTREEVALELPKLVRQIVELDIKKGYMISPTSALRSDRILRQSLDLAADGKIPEVIEMACNYIEQGNRLVVFSFRKAIAHVIAEGVAARLPIKVSVITGDVPHDKRHKIIDAKPDLLCATMDSCGSGVSLAYADGGLFAELHYVPAVLLQCEARFPRQDSKTTSKFVVYACARGTADDLIRRIVLAKLDTFQKAIGKTDDKLLDDLGASSREEASVRMRRLYERLLKEDAA
jgi:SWI/SNF-related matrix-associated actin-dependent regulator 1 of chromatin subfamily A